MIDIPVKTIRYYESIGLCTPSQTDENSNYRYYSIDDIFRLDLIRSLARQLGMPLKTVKEYLSQSKDVDQLAAYLHDQELEIDAEIEELRLRKKFLSKKIQVIQEGKKRPMMTPILLDCETRELSVRRELIHSVEEAMLVTRRITTLYDPNAENTMYMIRDVAEDRYEDLDGIQVFVGVNGNLFEAGLSLYTLEGGKYLRIMYLNQPEQRHEAMNLLRRFMLKYDLCRIGPIVNSGSVIELYSASSSDYCLTMEFMVK